MIALSCSEPIEVAHATVPATLFPVEWRWAAGAGPVHALAAATTEVTATTATIPARWRLMRPMVTPGIRAVKAHFLCHNRGVLQSSWGRILIVAAAVAIAATASAFAAPANATRAKAAQVVDRTYSCHVWRRHPFIFGTQVRVPPGGQIAAQPAMASVTTAADHAYQVVFKDVKGSLRVDAAQCRPSSRRVALKPSGLRLYQTVTPQFEALLNGRCPTHAGRVLVHFRVSLTSGTPQRASFAVAKEGAKRPLVFFKWSPKKISGYLGRSCTTF